MAEKVVWICDGCDAERTVDPTSTFRSDWHAFSVRAAGFKGYPTNAQTDDEGISGHLCKECSQRYWDALHPRLWPRPARPE